MAILKSMGMEGRGIRGTYLFLYGSIVLLELSGGLLPAWLTANLLAEAMVTSIGMLICLNFPALLILPLLVILLGVFAAYITLRIGKILRIAPVQTICNCGLLCDFHGSLQKTAAAFDWRRCGHNRLR